MGCFTKDGVLMAIMEAIATTYLEADAASVTFSGIPATYEHLEIRLLARTNRTYYIDPINIAINTDSSSSNFTVAVMQANGTSKSAYSSPTSLFMTYVVGNFITGGVIEGEDYGPMTMTFFDYANTSKNTTLQYMSGTPNTTQHIYLGAVTWDNTAAVNSIAFTPNNGTAFMRGTEFTLYGIKSS